MKDKRELKDTVCIFNIQDKNSDLYKYNNSSVWVLNRIDDKYNDEVSETMWIVKFYDGRKTEVFADELVLDD